MEDDDFTHPRRFKNHEQKPIPDKSSGKQMASVLLFPLSIRLPDFSAGAKNYRNSATFTSKKTSISVSFAVNSPESAPEVPEKPEIELEFIGVSTDVHFKICFLVWYRLLYALVACKILRGVKPKVGPVVKA